MPPVKKRVAPFVTHRWRVSGPYISPSGSLGATTIASQYTLAYPIVFFDAPCRLMSIGFKTDSVGFAASSEMKVNVLRTDDALVLGNPGSKLAAVDTVFAPTTGTFKTHWIDLEGDDGDGIWIPGMGYYRIGMAGNIAAALANLQTWQSQGVDSPDYFDLTTAPGSGSAGLRNRDIAYSGTFGSTEYTAGVIEDPLNANLTVNASTTFAMCHLRLKVA